MPCKGSGSHGQQRFGGGNVVKVFSLIEFPDVLGMVTLFLYTQMTFILFFYIFATLIFSAHEDLPINLINNV